MSGDLITSAIVQDTPNINSVYIPDILFKPGVLNEKFCLSYYVLST